MNSIIHNNRLVVLAEGRKQSGRDAFHSVRDILQQVGRDGTRPYRCRGARLAIAWWLGALCLGNGTGLVQAQEAGHQHEHSVRNTQKAVVNVTATNMAASPVKFELPPLPAGVEELKFSEFFVSPVGQRGLEVTETLRKLDGKRVRMLGYMVHQEEPPPGRFLLTPLPAQIHEHDNGLADDLPASMVYVSVPTWRDKPVPYAPGLMLLTGTLSMGNQAEPDGRISFARLALDPPAAAVSSPRSRAKLSSPPAKGAERLMSSTSRPANVVP